MQDITELQRRLTAALDRIGGGLDRMGGADAATGAAPAADVEDLRTELEAERARSAGLEERLQTTVGLVDERRTGFEQDMERSRVALAAMEQDRAQLKAANDALSSSNQLLQQAATEGLSDPGLVDAALRTELDALRTARTSDRAELDAIVSLLAPAVESDKEAGKDA